MLRKLLPDKGAYWKVHVGSKSNRPFAPTRLHGTNISHAGLQFEQWDIKNKGVSSLTGASSLAAQNAGFVPRDRVVQRANFYVDRVNDSPCPMILFKVSSSQPYALLAGKHGQSMRIDSSCTFKGIVSNTLSRKTKNRIKKK